jgi:hypothetical protein
MPVDSTKNNNRFLTAVADLLSRRRIAEPDQAEAAVRAVATEVSKTSKTAVDGAIKSVPTGWLRNPSSSTTTHETDAFLTVAKSVFGVERSDVASLVELGEKAAASSLASMVVLRAQKADANSPAQSVPLSFETGGDARVVRDALRALAKDTAFIDRLGGSVVRQQVEQLLDDDVSVAAVDAVKRSSPPPAIFAGGVQVPLAGDDGHPLPGAPWIRIASSTEPISAGRLGKVLVELGLMRNALSEEELRSAIQGAPARLLAGRGPDEGSLMLGLRRTGNKGIEVGFAVDVAKLRRFHPANVTDSKLIEGVTELVQNEWGKVHSLEGRGVPVGFVTQRRSPGVAKALAAFLDSGSKTS